jgi:chorismate mutase
MVNYLNLDDFREQMDEVNLEILYLIKRKSQILRKISKWKFENGKELDDKKRDSEILEKVTKNALTMNLNQVNILEIFTLMLEEGDKIQEKEYKKLEEKN